MIYRAGVMAALQGPQAPVAGAVGHRPEARAILPPALVPAAREPWKMLPGPARRFVRAEIDTAEAIAARYGLNPKSYRQRLRASISWYRKPQDWAFPVDSKEWRDIIGVAERMTGRSTSTYESDLSIIAP